MWTRQPCRAAFFFFNDTATTEIYTLSLHDALPISLGIDLARRVVPVVDPVHHAEQRVRRGMMNWIYNWYRSEEHTSELQSPDHIECRLLLEKKKIMHVQYSDDFRTADLHTQGTDHT